MKIYGIKDQKRQQYVLWLGTAGMFLCMIADWLLDVKPAGSVSNLVVESGWEQMSMWRFEASILIAAAIMPFYYMAVRELAQMLRKRCSSKSDFRMVGLFDISAGAAVLSFLFIHIVCCIMPVLWKLALEQGVDAAAAGMVTNGLLNYIAIPFFFYYFVADLGLSVAWVWFVLKKRTDLCGWAALCCPVFGLLLAELFHFVPWPAGEFGVAFESMGHMLMFIMGAVMCRKGNKIQAGG